MDDDWALAMSARGNPSGRFSIPDLFSGPTTCDILTMQYFGNKTLWCRVRHMRRNICKLNDRRIRVSLE
jgi:hypothetical protein